MPVKILAIGANDVLGWQVFVLTPVPEPQTCALLLAGLPLVGFMARRRKT